MDFYKRVEIACKKIPYGHTASYGQIALLCGKPRNARQVGYVLRQQMTRDIPAHRVVNSQGYLSGAGSFEYPELQKRLLETEAVYVSEDNYVDMERYGWNNTLEDALFLKEQFESLGI